MNFVDQIYQFNHDAGLLSKPYSDTLESSFQIEEALEGFDVSSLAELLHCDYSPKAVSRAIVQTAASCQTTIQPVQISSVDRLDKACDAIVFAFGSMFKLGLTPDQASRAVSAVIQANLAKLSMPKDSFGKLTKPADFVGPEAALAAILEERCA